MLIAYLLQPFVFGIGVWFVNSFAHSLVNAAVNTPIVAYAGFECYLVTGGLLCAIVIGIVVGVLL